MVAFPQISMNGCSAGINLFFGSVLPTLFPFFVAVNFMVRLGFPERVGALFEGMFRRLYGCSGMGAFICVLSMASGYPMAAKLVGDQCRSGRMSVAEGKKILSFSSVSGPLFLVGTVGTAMLGSAACGYIIAFGHYLAAVINGWVFCRFLWNGEDGRARPQGVRLRQACPSIAEALSDSILNAFRTLCQICGYIVLFSIAGEFLQFAGLLSLLPAPWQAAAAKGVLEMTMGCSAVAAAPAISSAFRLALCAFLVSFGGLSIAGQSLSMLSGSGISSRYYFFMKFCHGCLAAGVTMALALLVQKAGGTEVLASAVYGSQEPAVLVLGGFHSLLFSSQTAGLLCLLMGLIAAGHLWFRGMRRMLCRLARGLRKIRQGAKRREESAKVDKS